MRTGCFTGAERREGQLVGVGIFFSLYGFYFLSRSVTSIIMRVSIYNIHNFGYVLYVIIITNK